MRLVSEGDIAFTSIGIDVVLSTTTDAAETELSKTNFDMIITDMSRPPDKEAGLSLIKYLHEHGIKVPTIIYAAFWASKHLGKEEDFGAKLITNDPSQVYATVLNNLLKAS